MDAFGYIFVIVCLVFALIYYIRRNYDLEKENFQLNRKIIILQKNNSNLSGNNTSTETNFSKPIEYQSKSPQQAITLDYGYEKISETKKDSESTKNSAILVTGAIFIILAAIVFLSSSWDVLSAGIKSLIMFLFVGVFLGCSYLAKKKFNLEKTSKTFFYLAMAYIPICLSSLWALGIISDLWKSNIIDRFAYFTFVFVITGCIYYLFYTRNSSKILYVGSVLSGLFAAICFPLIFEEKSSLICLAVVTYSVAMSLLMLFAKKQNELFNKTIVYTLLVITSLFAICQLFGNIVIESISKIFSNNNEMFLDNLFVVISLVLVAINYLIVFFKYNRKTGFWVMHSISLYLATLFTTFHVINGVSTDWLIIISAIIAIIISLIHMFVTNKLNNGSLHLANRVLINSYMGYLLIRTIELVSDYDISKYILPIIAFIELIILGICFIKTNKSSTYKYLIYITSLLFIYSVVNCFNFKYEKEIYSLIPMCWSFIIYVLEGIVKKLRDGGSDALYIVSNIVSFIAIGFVENIVVYWIGIAYAVLLFIVNLIRKENDWFRLIPMLGAYFILSGNTVFADNVYLILRIIMAVLLTGFPLLTKKKLTCETLFAGLFVLLITKSIESYTIQLLFVLAWEFLNFIFVKSTRDKHLMLALIYATSLALYFDLIGKNKFLKAYSSSYKIGIVIVALLYIETIIKHHVKSKADRDLIDTLIFALIYLISIFSYTNEYDGMVFCLFMIAIMIYSYQRKRGSIFVTTITALIVNVLLLTRKFWAKVPWWGWLLITGTILIAFAVRNESKENKEKVSIGSKIKELKENIDNSDSSNNE